MSREADNELQAQNLRAVMAAAERDPQNYIANLIEKGLDGGVYDRSLQGSQNPQQRPILATPFQWRAPETIAPRQFLYGRHYVRKYLSATIAPGGVGKSALALTEAIAMASGKPILNQTPTTPLCVWYWNGEDPIDETERRIAAACIHHVVDPDSLSGRLFIDSGRKTEISIAKAGPRGGLLLNDTARLELIETIHENGIDVVIIDPFVSSHEVAENDNGQIAAVCKQWAQIADETGCAVELVHHARKMGVGNTGDVTADDARGASALIAAVRSARTLNQMTKEDAVKAKVEQHRAHVRIDDVKSNLAPPAEGAKWLKLVSVTLNNATATDPGDDVGVVTTWKWPDPSEDISPEDIKAVQARINQGSWWLDPQSRQWAGKAVAAALGLDADDPAARSTIKALIKTWVRQGALIVVKRTNDQRKLKDAVEVGE